jgi:hypothetical protein
MYIQFLKKYVQLNLTTDIFTEYITKLYLRYLTLVNKFTYSTDVEDFAKSKICCKTSNDPTG